MEQEQSKGFHVFDINAQIVAKGRKTTELVRTNLIRAIAQVVIAGGDGRSQQAATSQQEVMRWRSCDSLAAELA